MRKTRKNVPWKGWKKEAPNADQRIIMSRKCGKKCFLGPNNSFPVCKKNTCKISRKGAYAACVRASQWGKRKSSYKGKSHPTMKRGTYKKVVRKAKKLIKKLK